MISRSAVIGALVVAELAILGLTVQTLHLARPSRAAAAADGPPPLRASFELGPAPHVSVELTNTGLDIVGGPGGEVVLSETREGDAWGSGLPALHAEQTAGGLRVIEQNGAHGWSWGLHRSGRRSLRIVVPAAAQVEVTSANGRVTAAGLRAALRAHTSNGRIEVRDHRGDLALQTSNGSITLRDVLADRLEGATSNGRIEATGVRLRNGSLTTANGRISVVAAPGSDAVVQLSGRSARGGDGEDGRVVRLGAGTGHFTLESANGTIGLSQGERV